MSCYSSREDMELFKRAANVLWPGAVITLSGIVRSLARITAEKALKREKALERKRKREWPRATRGGVKS